MASRTPSNDPASIIGLHAPQYHTYKQEACFGDVNGLISLLSLLSLLGLTSLNDAASIVRWTRFYYVSASSPFRSTFGKEYERDILTGLNFHDATAYREAEYHQPCERAARLRSSGNSELYTSMLSSLLCRWAAAPRLLCLRSA